MDSIVAGGVERGCDKGSDSSISEVSVENDEYRPGGSGTRSVYNTGIMSLSKTTIVAGRRLRVRQILNTSFGKQSGVNGTVWDGSLSLSGSSMGVSTPMKHAAGGSSSEY